MAKKVEILSINEEVARCIKKIGQNIIERADEISKDLDDVATVTITSTVEADKILNFDVIKNYNIKDFIHYGKEEREYEITNS